MPPTLADASGVPMALVQESTSEQPIHATMCLRFTVRPFLSCYEPLWHLASAKVWNRRNLPVRHSFGGGRFSNRASPPDEHTSRIGAARAALPDEAGQPPRRDDRPPAPAGSQLHAVDTASAA